MDAEQQRRLAKVDALRDDGIEPYPYRFDRSATLGQVRRRHGDLGPGVETDDRVRVAGRVLLIRRQGRLTFATIRDREASIQLFVSQKVAGDDVMAIVNDLDLGDWVGVEGVVMTTNKGELSIKVDARRSSWPSRCARYRTSGRACPTSTPATASATSTSS